MSAATTEQGDDFRLVDLLLEEQQSLTPVERFSKRHATETSDLNERFYRDLIPSSAPGPSEQFAFRVDLDRCSGCKACVTACHSLNGLDTDETWRDVGTIIGDHAGEPVQQTVTTTCHHCEDPACLAGCPVRAYEKDPVTGIVRHLDDQCIGCQYCVLKCLYDVPKYDSTRGIVRKCDMCTGRLSAGEAPACVQGCPTDAITIALVSKEQSKRDVWLPVLNEASPDPTITKPTTQFVSQRLTGASMSPANSRVLEPSVAHTPLALMMVAVQLSVGLLIVDLFASQYIEADSTGLRAALALAAALVAVSGSAGSFVHLGRPLYAFRAFLGWRTSWMSREILVLGPFIAFVCTYAATWIAPPWVEATLGQLLAPDWLPTIRACSHYLAITFGLLGTFCSIMIYVDTRRPFWSFESTASRFIGSVGVLGPAGALAIGLVTGELSRSTFALGLCVASIASVSVKLSVESLILRHCNEAERSSLARSAALLLGPLRKVFTIRLGSAVVAALLLACFFLPLQSAQTSALAIIAVAAFGLFLIGEGLERHLFFRAEAARAMPGL